MDPKVIEALTQQVHRRFPEFAGVKAKVRKQPLPKGGGRKPVRPEKRNYLLTFKKDVRGPGGLTITRWVRVVASPKGKIIKITTSK